MTDDVEKTLSQQAEEAKVEISNCIDLLLKENSSLKVVIRNLEVVKEERDTLLARLTLAKKNNKTLKHVECLEGSITDLNACLDEHRKTISAYAVKTMRNEKEVSDAEVVMSAIRMIAQSLGIKHSGYPAVQLLTTIHDKIKAMK